MVVTLEKSMYRGVGTFCVLLLVCISLSSALSTDTVLLKIAGTSGDVIQKSFLVSEGTGRVQASISSVSCVSLSPSSFTLSEGTLERVLVSFNASACAPGVHVGKVILTDDEETIKLPLLFEIESKDVFYDINLEIPPRYVSITPGEKLIAQVKLYDLTWGGITHGLGANPVSLEYAVQGIDGTTLLSESETIVVDRQTLLAKTLSLPPSTSFGTYVFTVTASYQSSVGTASYLFTVDAPVTPPWFASGEGKFILLIGAVILVFFGILAFFFYLLRDRDSLLVQLQHYNDAQFRRQRSLLLMQQRALLQRKGRSFAARVMRPRLLALKKKHAHRAQSLRHLHKKGNVQAMKRQLLLWKKEYASPLVPQKLSGLSTSEMRSLLTRWKRDYKH